MDVENYQLPDPTWEWVSKEWMIDMTGDVDEAGWQYALKFHGAVWHGNYKHFRSFVRRRRWLRLRRSQVPPKNPLIIDTPPPSTCNQFVTETEAITNLKKCRLDRERLVVLDALIKSTLPRLQDRLLEKVNIPSSFPNFILLTSPLKAPELMAFFDYDESKYKFLHQILLHKYSAYTRSFHLSSSEKKAIQSLSFYYDIQRILNSIDPSHQ